MWVRGARVSPSARDVESFGAYASCDPYWQVCCGERRSRRFVRVGDEARGSTLRHARSPEWAASEACVLPINAWCGCTLRVRVRDDSDDGEEHDPLLCEFFLALSEESSCGKFRRDVDCAPSRVSLELEWLFLPELEPPFVPLDPAWLARGHQGDVLRARSSGANRTGREY